MVEKSKLHPFANHLRRGEEILWMSSPSTQMNLERREVRYAVIGTVGLFIVTVLMFARRALTPGNTLPFMIHLAYELSPCCALLAMVFLPTVWALKQRWPTDYDYAVTNLRLLHRYKDQVQTIRLEEIPSVTLLLTGSRHGNLRFGDAFPGWYDLDDAARIQHIIQDARERRLEGV